MYTLISATLAILVSLTFVTPIEGEIVGVKFNFSNPTITGRLAGIICTYFLVIYIISVLQDLGYYRYRTMPVFFKQKMFFAKIAEEFVNKIHRANNRVKVVEDKMEDRREFLDAIELIGQKYQLKIDELDEELFSNKEHLELAKSILDQKSQLKEKCRQEQLECYDFLENYSKQDGVAELVHELEQTKEALDISFNKKLEFILKTHKRYQLYYQLRLIVEIAFPLVLALYAIWVSVIRSW